MARIAMLVGEGYEDSEFQTPYNRMQNAGHEVIVIGVEKGAIVHDKLGTSQVEVEYVADEIQVDDIDAVIIPGGHGPDKLRLDPVMVEFTREFAISGKPLAAICHGPQLLIESDVVKGRSMTSWPSIRKDLINAGADWKDQAVVEDANLITSRQPADLDAFCEAILRRL